MTPIMTFAQVVETSVTITDNSPFKDKIHPDDQTTLLKIRFVFLTTFRQNSRYPPNYFCRGLGLFLKGRCIQSILNVYKDKLIVQCINSLPALPILAYNFDDLDRDQPKILVSFVMPVCHVMQTYRLIVKASKIFETNYRKMR